MNAESGAKARGSFVSVVTPFHNTARYLRECIESVLNQTHGNFEYILLDNASTDGSSEIASEYAARDSRVRIFKTESLLPQVANYNRALSLISARSRYCKIVQADDWIFPACIERMISLAEASPRVGIVSSLRLDGELVKGAGLSDTLVILPGRDVARFHLLGKGFIFGTPSTLLLRSDIVRSRQPFYDEDSFQEDTEACYEILREWDFGFVPEILSYSRVDPNSLFMQMAGHDSVALGRLIVTRRYGPHFLSASEYGEQLQTANQDYCQALANAAVRLRGWGYWRFHIGHMRRAQLSVDIGVLAVSVAREATGIVSRPRTILRKVFRAILGR